MRYLIRYGEISLKSKQVRGKLEELLKCNILGLCKKNSIKAKATKARGRIMLESKGPADNILKKCFGVVSFSQVRSSPSEIEEIEKIVKKTASSGIKKGESFKIDVNRAWKGFSHSTKKTEELLGSCVADLTGAAVDLSKPDKTIYVEIGKETSYIFSEKTAGPGGMPFGSAGRGILLISNRNSAIAGWLMMKRGMDIIPLYVGTEGKEREQVEAHLRVLSSFMPGALSLLVFQSREVSKKQALKIAERVCDEKGCLGIVTGDMITGAVERDSKVYCPLVGFSEKEVSLLAERIGLGKERSRTRMSAQ